MTKAPIDPVTVTLPDATARTGLSRSPSTDWPLPGRSLW